VSTRQAVARRDAQGKTGDDHVSRSSIKNVYNISICFACYMRTFKLLTLSYCPVQAEEPMKLREYYRGVYPALIGTVASSGTLIRLAMIRILARQISVALQTKPRKPFVCAGLYFYFYALLRKIFQVRGHDSMHGSP
jgi:hypothetical protein